MLDIRLIREKPQQVRDGFARLGATVDLDGVLALDEEVRKLKNESQSISRRAEPAVEGDRQGRRPRRARQIKAQGTRAEEAAARG